MIKILSFFLVSFLDEQNKSDLFYMRIIFKWGTLMLDPRYTVNSTNLNSGSNPVHYLRSLSDVSNYVRSLCVYESDLYAGSNKLISIWNIDTMKIKRQITIPGEVFTLHIIKGMSHTYNALLMSHI